MFNIEVLDMKTAMERVQKKPPTRLISLLDINSPVRSFGPHHLMMYMTDIVELPEWATSPYLHSTKRPVLPSKQHLSMAFKFTRDLTDQDDLLIHCWAGKSRSAAIAIGVLIQHGMAPEDAFDHIASIRPQMIPNHLVIRLIDDFFDLKSALIHFHTQWDADRIEASAIFNK